MHSATERLSREIRDLSSLNDRVKALRDAYAQAECLVVTCGPSLGDVSKEQLQRASDGRVTIAVKQATDVVGDVSDFHCFNAFNVSRFSPAHDSTIRCFVADAKRRSPQFNGRDLEFEQRDGNGDLRNSLAHERSFQGYELANGLVRPFGPGIMYELVFFLAAHVGVSRITTVGWDIGDPAGQNTHFYDDDSARSYFSAGRAGPGSGPRRLRDLVPEPIKFQRRRLQNKRAHAAGALYNRTQALPGESELVSSSVPALVEWLAGHGCELRVVSPSPHFPPGVARVSIDD
jgi:hypothetical protein